MPKKRSQKKPSPEILRARKEFGQRLKAGRERLDWTQHELADRLGVQRQTVSNWEAGVTTPDVTDLLILREVTQEQTRLDIGELFGEPRIDSGDTPFSYTVSFLRDVERMGIRGVYHNRRDALNAFTPFLAREPHSICIVSSSLLGVLRVADRSVATLLKEKAAKANFQILMTHPERSRLREAQEGRGEGSIEGEIQESVDILLNEWKVKKENIRFYNGAPTTFLIFTPERMLLNPYSYETEAFKTFTLEVAPVHTEREDIYSQFLENHFPWESPNSVSLEEVRSSMKPRKGS